MSGLRSTVWKLRYKHLRDDLFYDRRRASRVRLTPNLFLVGAQKCGTSSLHHYLDAHPDIFMSKPLKEPGYYVPWDIIQAYYKRKNLFFQNRSDLLTKGMLVGYRDETYIGDSSTFYTNGTYNIDVKTFKNDKIDIERIKIVYLIRNPFDRIISHYLHACRNNNFKGDLNSFVLNNSEAIDISCYGKQIETYYEYLEPDQIAIESFERLVTQPQNVLNLLYQFLNVKPVVSSSFRSYNAAPKTQNQIREDARFDQNSWELIHSAIREDAARLDRFGCQMHHDWDLEKFRPA